MFVCEVWMVCVSDGLASSGVSLTGAGTAAAELQPVCGCFVCVWEVYLPLNSTFVSLPLMLPLTFYIQHTHKVMLMSVFQGAVARNSA